MFWNVDVNTEAGAHKVLLKRGEFVDQTRHNEDGSVRTVPYKIYHPAETDEKLPVIIWSHGFGGNRDGAAFLSRYISSHGYVLVHLTHHGTDSSLWEGKEGHPWDILRKAEISRETTLHRFRDVPFLIDELEQWAADNPEVGRMMDLSLLGMSGHSFGALTTQVMSGQLYPDFKNTLTRMKEQRFKAGIAYSMNPITHLTEAKPEELYGAIDIPIFYMTGTEDSSPISGNSYEYRLPLFEHAGAGERYLLVKNDGDHMVYAGSRGKLGVNPNREKHENIIKLSSLAFWDAKLKSDQAAQEWLSNQGIQSYISGDAEFRSSV